LIHLRIPACLIKFTEPLGNPRNSSGGKLLMASSISSTRWCLARFRHCHSLPGLAKPVYLEIVSRLATIVEDLKSLPPDKLEEAADFIRRLKPIGQAEREAILARTFGSLSHEDADAMQKAIEEGCERVDEQGW